MTKRHLLLLSLLTFLLAWRAEAQFTPQGFNYQCIVRDDNGSSLNNQTVNLLFTIRSGAPNGPVAYSEMQTSSTNEFGLINLVIGQGNPLQGTFGAINWGGSAKFLTVSVETAPNVFDELGTTQLMSVPYALYAENTTNGGDDWGAQTVQTSPVLSGDGTGANPLTLAPQGAQSGQVLKWNGTTWVPQDDFAGTVTEVNTGAGLTGGPITATGTISLANTPVTPGAYGSSTQIPVVTVDQQGRVTDIFTVSPQPNTVGITGAAGIDVTQNGINFTITNTGDTNANDDVTNTTQADGDISGVFSNLQIKPDVVGSPEIADNAVGNSELADNAVNTAELANGAVTAAKINNMGATSGQVLKWTGTTWAPAQDALGTVTLNSGPGINVTGNSPVFTINNTGDTDASDDITTSSTANGDVTGPFSNLQLKPGVVGFNELASNAVVNDKISDGAVTGSKIAQQGAINGQVLKWNGTTWAPATDLEGNITIIGGVGIDVIVSGDDYTIANSGDVNPFDDITENSIADGDVFGPFSNLQIRQSAVTNFEIANNAVTTAKIQDQAITASKLAQMGAFNGQILKWNGTAWAPANDLGNDNWGTQVAQTGPTISGNGTLANPLNLDPQGAIVGQVLKFNGTNWIPGTDNDSGPDNWGTQVIISDSELTGDGTVGSPLELAGQGATPGQVLKWNGASWSPEDDNDSGGDDWGAQVAFTNTTLTGNGTGGNELGIAQQGATNGQVLKWDTGLNSWIPADDNDSAPDNWGTQVVISDSELTGDGTVGSPLELADQGATPGQVLKWNGASWSPEDDNDTGGDDWGAQTALTDATIAGNGTVGNELGIAQQGAANGQVLKWDDGLGTWVPSDDDTGTGPSDNWGVQVAITNATLEGDGTVGNPLGIAQQGANVDQVLKWDGATWTPADEATPDNWGTQVVEVSAEFAGNGTAGTPLELADQGATNGQVLKFDGANWVPGDDQTDLNVYTAGTGINITGSAPNFTIENTGDLSGINELQTISLSGNDLTLSNGGGTVTLPAANTYSAGAGISITGSAPNFTIENTGDDDNDATNELQTLMLNGEILSISGTNSSVSLDTVLGNAGIGLWNGVGVNIYNGNSGNVGVGTNMPQVKFHVRSDGESIRVQGNEPGIGFTNGNSPGAYLSQASGAFSISTIDSSSIIMATGGGKVFTIDGTTGNIGAGGFNTGTARFKVLHDNSVGGLMIENTLGAFWEFRVNAGTGGMELYNNTFGAIPAGTFAANGLYTPSDRRLKKDIVGLPAVLDQLLGLDPVTYRYKQETEDQQRSLGFIAQDVQAAFPELVINHKTQDGGEYLALNYAGLSVVAIKAIQEQQTQIATLKEENSNLLEQLNALEKRVMQIEAGTKASGEK
ncbi:MAG: tail fiber domain-containing protein [Bacteroidetes bacterium]|nr:MAG: tail fiber domain-containing protein [Bacteroidota bacterium]